MCRIAGIIDPSKTISDLEWHVRAMCESMKHGGPDDEGIYSNNSAHLCMGNRRLSLLDLSKAGHQPMEDSTGRCLISFNGEIYNYRELKQELLQKGHTFKSLTDTEVILASYIEWGITAFSRLEGMFAFSLYDTALQEMFLVRDAAGIKPLYYNLDKESLVFSSEMKAFKKSGRAYRQNENWKLLLLCFGHLPEPYSTLQNVKALPKGHYLYYPLHTNNQAKVVPFVKADRKIAIEDKETAIREIQNELEASVSREMECDAPIGIMLSGGIDSSIIALLADKASDKQKVTVSLDFEEKDFSEKGYQEKVLSYIHPFHKTQKLCRADLEENFTAIKNAYDQPSCDGINTWFISKFANEHGLKAIVSGIGSDELFGGYPSFKRLRSIATLQKLPYPVLNFSALMPGGYMGRMQWLQLRNRSTGMFLALRGLFSPSEAGKILGLSMREVLGQVDALDLQPHLPEAYPKSEWAGWLEFNLYMQNQLLKDSDYMSMQHAVELRMPFLGSDFLTTIDSIVPGLLFGHGGLPKQLLIDAFRNMMPREVWDRPKMGFSLPLHSWLPQIEELRESLQQEKSGVLLMSDFDHGKVHWSKIWAYYLSLEFAA